MGCPSSRKTAHEATRFGKGQRLGERLHRLDVLALCLVGQGPQDLDLDGQVDATQLPGLGQQRLQQIERLGGPALRGGTIAPARGARTFAGER